MAKTYGDKCPVCGWDVDAECWCEDGSTVVNDKAVEAARKALRLWRNDLKPPLYQYLAGGGTITRTHRNNEATIAVEAAAPHIERAFVDRLTETDWHRLRHLLNGSAKIQLGTDDIKNTGRRQLKGLIPE